MRREETFERDMTFHVNRRRYGKNVPATDIDFLEYDHHIPVLLWEAKSHRSKWKEGRRTSSMRAQWKLAQMAGIDYAVVEHTDDWSAIAVYTIGSWEKQKPIIANEIHMSLPQFVKWLYIIRGREMPQVIRIPNSLNPIIFSHSP